MRRIILLAVVAITLPATAQVTGGSSGSAGADAPGAGPATTGTLPPSTDSPPGVQTGERPVNTTTTTDPTGATTSVGATGSATVTKGTIGEGAPAKDTTPKDKHGKRRPGATPGTVIDPTIPKTQSPH
jgi:hypothetical protein